MFVSSAKADTVITVIPFSMDFKTNEAFAYQDLYNSATFTFTITDGNLTGAATLDTNNLGGTLVIIPDTTGTITLTSNLSNYTLTINGNAVLSNIIHFSASVATTIKWVYNTVINPDYPSTLNVRPFWQYLFSGNLLGFFGAIFLFSFVMQDLLVGAITMLFLVPIYLKTRSLLLLVIIWIILGPALILAMPAVSGLGLIFTILGVAGLLWRLVHPN
jgi:hypothetical protein